MKKYIIYLLGALVLLGCNNTKNKKTDVKKRQFTQVTIPAMLTSPEDKASYIGTHYWDNFDFSDTVLISLPNVTEQAFVDYINILPVFDSKTLNKSISVTLSKAKVDDAMFAYFSELFEKYLFDANSPFRSDELYIPYLKYMIDSVNVEEIYKERHKYQLNMALKNRPNEMANDFKYTTISSTGSLYKIKADMTILFFYNPDCPNCAEVKQKLISSNIISNAPIKILAIYTDKDIELWKSSLNQMPKHWIVGYDANSTITKDALYDTKAMPTLYLIDKDKRVILKDTDVEKIETYLIGQKK